MSQSSGGGLSPGLWAGVFGLLVAVGVGLFVFVPGAGDGGEAAVGVEDRGTPLEVREQEPLAGLAAEVSAGPDEPTVVDATRAAAEGTELRGLWIEAEGGGAVAGARVSVHPLTNDVLGWFWTPSDSEVLFQIAERTERILEQRVVGSSDEEGYVSLAAEALLAAPEGWVMWVTHPGFLPRSVIGGAGGAEWPDQVALVPGAGGRARVLDAGGEAVAGAVVRLQALLPEELGAHDDPERLVRRALVRVGDTDASGAVELHAIGGPSLVQATMGERASVPVRRAGPEDVVLELVDTFEVSGSVRSVDGTALGQWGVVQVSELQPGGGERRLAAAPCGQGGFTGMVVPRVPEAGEYQARLMFGEVEACVRRFAAPPAGGRVELEFELRPGIVQWFKVVEWGDQEQGVVGANLSLTWSRDGQLAGSLTADSGPDGYVMLHGIPVGTECFVHATSEGFENYHSPANVFEAGDAGQARQVRLSRAGSLRVRVTRDGEPVDGASFCIWDDYRASAPAFRLDVPGEDGWHVLRKIIAYHQGSIAVVEGPMMISEPQPFDFPDVGVPLEIEIELADLVPVRGRVVEAGSGEAVTDAEIWLGGVSRGGQTVDTALEPVFVDEDGRFEALYPPVVQATAGAYSEVPVLAARQVMVRRGADGAFDFGDIPIQRGFDLPVRLASVEGDTAWEGYRVVGGFHQRSETRGDFDAAGRCLLHVPAQFSSLTVYTPRGASVGMVLPTLALPGDEVEVTLHTRDTLWLEFVDAAGEPVRADGSCELYYRTGELSIRAVSAFHDSGPRVGIPRPVTERALVVWHDPSDPERFARGEILFDEPGDIVRTLSVRRDVSTAKVVDSSGTPLSDIIIRMVSRQTRIMGNTFKTGPDGRAQLQQAPDDPEILLIGGQGGAMPLPAGAPLPKPGEEVTWTFDPQNRIELLCVDRGAAVPYADAFLRFGVDGGPQASVQADGDGAASLGPYGPGEYGIEVLAANRFPAHVRVQVPCDPIEVELRGTGGLELSVESAAGKPLVGAPVSIHCEDLGESVDQWRADGRLAGAGELRTDAAGRCALDGLPWGQYEVTVAGASGTAVVEPGSTARLEIQAP